MLRYVMCNHSIYEWQTKYPITYNNKICIGGLNFNWDNSLALLRMRSHILFCRVFPHICAKNILKGKFNSKFKILIMFCHIFTGDEQSNINSQCHYWQHWQHCMLVEKNFLQ